MDALALASRDNSVDYDAFKAMMIGVFCLSNASRLSQRAYKNYRQTDTEPVLEGERTGQICKNILISPNCGSILIIEGLTGGLNLGAKFLMELGAGVQFYQA